MSRGVESRDTGARGQRARGARAKGADAKGARVKGAVVKGARVKGVRPAGVRLQKFLAGLGFGSRREIEGWIRDQRVRVNGKAAQLGLLVGDGDVVQFGEQRIEVAIEPTRARVLLYNKRTGEICTRHDPEGRTTVFARLPRLRSGRWVSIGRLDFNTSGVLLFTNDGTLAHRLMHPSAGIDREYAVRVDGTLEPELIQRLLDGVELEDGPASFSDVRYYAGQGRNHWYHVVMMEGRRREVRRMFEAVGARVTRLKRVRFGPVILPSRLRSGKCMELNEEEVRLLFRLVRLSAPAEAGPPRPSKDRRKSVLLPYPGL